MTNYEHVNVFKKHFQSVNNIGICFKMLEMLQIDDQK